MKAIVFEETGSSAVLKLQDKPLTDPGAGEVRVRVVVSGVNPTDWKARAAGGSTKLEAPKVPNQDGAGVIDEIGSGVTGFSIGDRVWLWDVVWGGNEGTAQEYAVVPAVKAVASLDGFVAEAVANQFVGQFVRNEGAGIDIPLGLQALLSTLRGKIVHTLGAKRL